MYCSNCGKKNPNSAQFCENCGGPLPKTADAGPALSTAGQGIAALEFVNEHKKPLIIGLAAVIVLYLVISLLAKPKLPIDAAEKYLDAISGQSYAKAYKYIDPELNMSKKAFVYSMQEMEKKVGPVKEYRIENEDLERKQEDSLASSFERNYSIVLGRTSREVRTLEVKNVSASEEADWRVEPFDSFRTRELQLGPLPDLKVKVCGEEVNVTGIGRCKITYFDDIALPVEVSSPSIAPYKFEYPPEAEDFYVAYQASAKTRQEIQNTLNNFFTALNKAIAEHSMNAVESTVVMGSGAWNEMENGIRSENNIYTFRVTRINSIELSPQEDKLIANVRLTLEGRDQQGNLETDDDSLTLMLDKGTWKVSDF